ncbi:NUDIX hydrolase [Candidatus Protochlamydia amoebophila]|uniref:NUDIX hydrolase n=1 Tax=Candidatus Protochlamydia amoebophila TaxID=362787 RepID=UPI00068C71C6|nr:NUDIX hydrolase [Candidatus Protochlamydia amoebophila]
MQNFKKTFAIPFVEETTLAFEESFIKIKRDRLRLAHEDPYSYYTLITPPQAVVVLARTADGYYVLNEEYRHPTKKILLCFPGGFIDDNENPLVAAKRELEEETGYTAESFHLLGSAYPYPGISGQKTFYVKALGAKFNMSPRLEPSEIIQTRLCSFNQLKEMISKNAELDGTLCTALFFNSLSESTS